MNGERFRTVFDIHVVLGSLNRYQFTEETVIMHVDNIIVHPEYSRFESFAHDIGILIVCTAECVMLFGPSQWIQFSAIFCYVFSSDVISN